jgi:HSP20 family molecular chaperone IbpA
MKVAPELIKTLAESADLINTINGGMSLAHVEKFTMTDHYLVTVKVPGVDGHSLKLELHKDLLLVFQLMHLEDDIEIPYLITSVQLDENIDKRAVHVDFQGKNLNIVLPFEESEDSREIKF